MKISEMASEAQRLIGISLTKIAQSRATRGGVSLHKNLLVATVLQKARYIFMEEAYNMVHYQAPTPIQSRIPSEEDLIGLTAEEAGLDNLTTAESSNEACLQEFLQPSCVKCSDSHDKENQPPYQSIGELTYFDLDKSPNVLRGRNNSCLKRRRAVTEWETEEAVQSILPKRSKSTEEDDSVFLDDATTLSENVSREAEKEEKFNETAASSTMEIDRITSLVSFFSFGVGDGKLSRSVSTPDLCSAQAKESGDTIQRPYLAMTV